MPWLPLRGGGGAIAEDTERLKHKTQITPARQDVKPLLSMVLEKQ